MRRAPLYYDPAKESGSLRKALGFVATFFTKINGLDNHYVAFKAQLNEEIESYVEKKMNYERLV